MAGQQAEILTGRADGSGSADPRAAGGQEPVSSRQSTAVLPGREDDNSADSAEQLQDVEEFDFDDSSGSEIEVDSDPELDELEAGRRENRPLLALSPLGGGGGGGDKDSPPAGELEQLGLKYGGLRADFKFLSR